jgi:hypothetical protein
VEAINLSKEAILTYLVKFLSWSNPLDLCSVHFPCQIAGQGGILNDPTVWLNGASHPLSTVSKIIQVRRTQKFDPLGLMTYFGQCNGFAKGFKEIPRKHFFAQKCIIFLRCCDIQHNGIRHNDTQHYGLVL